MDKPQFIYALVDPRTNKIRYVGKSTDPKVRRKHHMLQSQSPVFHNKRKGAWVIELYEAHLKPVIQILEECTVENWKHRERFWIRKLRREGADLLNLSEGGNGTGFHIGRKQSEETKEKLREANRKQFSDADKRMRHSQAIRDWHASLSPEKRKRAEIGLSSGRRVGQKAAKAQWENLTPEDKAIRTEKLHAWRKNLSAEEFSKIQRERCMKRYQK